jgi:hypothetical protein
MLHIKNIDRKTVEGTWIERELFGQIVRFKIRPRTDPVIKEIREEFVRSVNGVETLDDKGLQNALYDYLLESFEGICDETGRPIDVNVENKKALLFMDVPLGEPNNLVFVTDKAIRLGVQVHEDALKN